MSSVWVFSIATVGEEVLVIHYTLPWPLCVADADIIFLPCGFYLSIFFIPRLISAVADWMWS